MDNMIRAAAEQHHPSYDNKAWDKMEQLLDKHLPQKKDRRGFVFFLLLFLLIGGGLFVAGYYFAGNKNEKIAGNESKKEAGKSPVTTTATVVPDNNSTPVQNGTSVIVANDNSNDNTRTADGPVKQQANTLISGKNVAKTNIHITSGNAVADETGIAMSQPTTNNPQQGISSINNSGITKSIGVTADKKSIMPDVNKNPVENKQDIQSTLKKPADADIVKEVAKEKNPRALNDEKTASTEKKKSKHSIAGNFGLSFSMGPDISLVQINKPGNVTLSYGVGLSYTFIKKLTLQTGFYVSKKLYSSDSAHYHPATAFWSYYPDMENDIEANCKVYEIPINLLYNFGQKGKHGWRAGAGVSSYFMKHETYDYSYKYAGQSYPKSYSLDNENQHNFAVLTFTGGYQYNLSPRVSLAAEPYVKLPLTGIGFGKVQLKGGGALFSVTLKPFAKKNKK